MKDTPKWIQVILLMILILAQFAYSQQGDDQMKDLCSLTWWALYYFFYLKKPLHGNQ